MKRMLELLLREGETDKAGDTYTDSSLFKRLKKFLVLVYLRYGGMATYVANAPTRLGPADP